MADAADPTLGAKYQEELAREALKVADEYATLYLKVLMQDGVLPGTIPPKNAAEAVALGGPTAMQLIQRMYAGEQLTEREQRFVQDWLDARSKVNGQGA